MNYGTHTGAILGRKANTRAIPYKREVRTGYRVFVYTCQV